MFDRLKNPDATTLVEEMEGARRATGSSSTSVRDTAGTVSDPEVLEKPKRRRFTAKYKLHVVEQADACTDQGETGALLRREGLYSSHVTNLAAPARFRRPDGFDALQARAQGRPCQRRITA